MEKDNKKIINAWALYDWANSAYNLVIGSTVFPAYYIASTRSFFKGDEIDLFGLRMSNTVAQTYTYTLSYLIICITSPLLGGIADYSGKRKFFMQFFVLIGSLSCMGLYFFTGDNVAYGLLMMMLASVGFWGSLVFYNSFLPEIASPENYDRVSAKGFTMGYIGSVLLLVFNLSMLLFPEMYFNVEAKARELISTGVSKNINDALVAAKDYYGGLAARISFITVGLWWLGFSQYSFYYLKEKNKQKNVSLNHLQKGIEKLKEVMKQVAGLPQIKKYLTAYFFYNTGVQTVMVLAATFGAKVLNLPSSILITTILVIQIVAVLGAYLFSYVSRIKGNIYSLSIMVFIWILISIAALFINSAASFIAVGAIVGMVMGGIQSLSRATYSKLLPPEADLASYFSFYDVLEKVGLVLGTAIFAGTEIITGNMRYSVVPILMFFLVGFILLRRVRMYSPPSDM